MHSARSPSLLEEAGLVENQNRIWVGKRLQCILKRHVAQGIRIPASATEQRLLTPEPGIARDFGSRPASLAPFGTKQSVRERSAEAATRSWLNRGRMRPFTSRRDEAHNSSVASIDVPVVHDARIMVTQ